MQNLTLDLQTLEVETFATMDDGQSFIGEDPDTELQCQPDTGCC